jgi:hypothetical protein
MKNCITSALFVLGLVGITSQANAQAPATKAPVATQLATTLSPKQKALCKEWKFTASETFSLEQSPTAEQKGDVLILMENGRYRMMLNGKPEGGTWTADKAGKTITLTQDATSEVKTLKVIEQTETRLKVDYRDKDDIHNILIYEAK